MVHLPGRPSLQHGAGSCRSGAECCRARRANATLMHVSANGDLEIRFQNRPSLLPRTGGDGGELVRHLRRRPSDRHSADRTARCRKPDADAACAALTERDQTITPHRAAAKMNFREPDGKSRIRAVHRNVVCASEVPRSRIGSSAARQHSAANPKTTARRSFRIRPGALQCHLRFRRRARCGPQDWRFGCGDGAGRDGSARITSVPAFKERNDTSGIIAYSLYQRGADVQAMALSHLPATASPVKLTGVDAQYGGYISFACVWVHPAIDRPLRAFNC